MKTAILLFLTCSCLQLAAQSKSESKVERKGFVFGTSAGLSSLHLQFAGRSATNTVTASLPNIKIGWMASQRTALLLCLPGSIYTYSLTGRKRDRGFEAIIPSVQYWASSKLWLQGGVGLGMDAPAFYDIKNADEGKFYFGTATLVSVGYEIWQKGRFTVDLQARFHYGTANRPEGQSKGSAVDFLIGVNWY